MPFALPGITLGITRVTVPITNASLAFTGNLITTQLTALVQNKKISSSSFSSHCCSPHHRKPSSSSDSAPHPSTSHHTKTIKKPRKSDFTKPIPYPSFKGKKKTHEPRPFDDLLDEAFCFDDATLRNITGEPCRDF